MTIDPLSVDLVCKSPLVDICFVFKWHPIVPFVAKPRDTCTVTVTAKRFPLPLRIWHEMLFSELSHFVLQWEVSLVCGRVCTRNAKLSQHYTRLEPRCRCKEWVDVLLKPEHVDIILVVEPEDQVGIATIIRSCTWLRLTAWSASKPTAEVVSWLPREDNGSECVDTADGIHRLVLEFQDRVFIHRGDE